MNGHVADLMSDVRVIFVSFPSLGRYDRLEALDPIVVLDLLQGRAVE